MKSLQFLGRKWYQTSIEINGLKIFKGENLCVSLIVWAAVFCERIFKETPFACISIQHGKSISSLSNMSSNTIDWFLWNHSHLTFFITFFYLQFGQRWLNSMLKLEKNALDTCTTLAYAMGVMFLADTSFVILLFHFLAFWRQSTRLAPKQVRHYFPLLLLKWSSPVFHWCLIR